MRIYRSLQDQVLIPNFPDLAFWRSTESEVGRPSGRPMCTETCTGLGLRAGRPGGRPIQRVHSLDMAPVSALWILPRSTDRSTDRLRPRCSRLGGRLATPTVINMTMIVGRSIGRSTDKSSGLEICPNS